MTACSAFRLSPERERLSTDYAPISPPRSAPTGPTRSSAAWLRKPTRRSTRRLSRDGSLEAWVRDRAFRQHCALFSQRPFLWHISDGLKDGFSVFVHYHRFDQANLRKLTYTVLGDWLARVKAENNALCYEKGRELQQKLENILEGEEPYDIFVRWKSLDQQPLGWDPDLDDGVRQNIRPFIMAGVLTHDLSKIQKDKDRGKNVASAPWYDVFNGERRNDHHTTLAEKRAAREAAAKRVEGARGDDAARRPSSLPSETPRATTRRPTRRRKRCCGVTRTRSSYRSSQRCASDCRNC